MVEVAGGRVCVLAVVAAVAALPAVAATFVAGFHGPVNQRFVDVTLTPDGGFAATGWEGALYVPTVTKFDAAGNVQWSWRYPDGTGGSIAALSDGSLVVAGVSSVMRIDALGLPLWRQTLSAPGYPYGLSLKSIAVGPGDSIVLGGSVLVVIPSGEETFADGGRLLVRLDASGTVLSSWLYDPTWFTAINQVAFAPDGSVLVAGRGGPWAARLDATGAVLWQTALTPSAAGSAAYGIAATLDGGMVVVGATGADPATGFLARVDPAGALLWWREAPEWAGWGQVDVTADGGFVVATGRQITKLSAIGDVEWAVRYPAPARRSSVGFAALAADPTGELVAVGALDPGGHGTEPEEGALLARLDALGGTTPACAQLVPATVTLGATRSLAPATASPSPAGVVAAAASLPTPSTTDLRRFEPCVCLADTYEPDDGCGGGSWLDPGTVQDHNFCVEAGSEDWVAVDACAGETYTLRTLGLGPAADTVLELYAPDCTTLLASDDDSGGGRASRLDWMAPADGTYHLRVFQSDGSTGPGREYQLGHDVAACTSPGWIRDYLTAFSESYGSHVRALASGNLLVAARTWDGAGRGPHLLELDPSGAPLRGVRLQASAWDDVSDVIATRDGGFALAARMGTGIPTYYRDAWVVKLDAALDVVWSLRLAELRPTTIAEDDDGHLLVVGQVLGSAGGYDAWVGYLRPDGGVEWQETLDGGWRAYDDMFVGAVPLRDGFVLCGQTHTPESWIVRIDRAGALLWDERLGELPVTWCAAAPAGGILVAGWQWSVPLDPEAWVGELDTSGSFSWHAAVGADRPTAAAVGPTGDIFLSAGDRIVRVGAPGIVRAGYRVLGAASVPPFASIDASLDGIVAVGTDYAGGPGLPAFTAPLVMRLPPSGVIAGCDRVVADRVLTTAIAVAPYAGASTIVPGTVAVTAFVPGVTPGWAAPFELCRGDALLPPLEVSPGASLAPLRMVKAGLLEWEDGAASGSDVFDLYRGDLAALRADGDTGACLEYGIGGTSTTDLLAPAVPSAWVYHVSGVNRAGEGPVRLDRAGAAQPPTSPCP